MSKRKEWVLQDSRCKDCGEELKGDKRGWNWACKNGHLVVLNSQVRNELAERREVEEEDE